MLTANSTREWPYGFLDKFWEHNSCEFVPPKDVCFRELAGSIEYVLAVCNLKEREKDILRRRFQDLLTYQQIGDMYGVSKERIREIIVKSMVKLRRNSKFKSILSEGVTGYCRSRYNIALNEKVNEMVREQVLIKRTEDIKRWVRVHDFVPTVVIESPVATDKKLPIGALGLSTRSFNCMRNSNLWTVEDVLALTCKEDLMGIRNLGKGSYKEIIQVLEENGYNADHLK